MGLLATCLLPLLAPQAPNPTPVTPTPPAVVAPSQDPLDLAAVRAAEADDAKAEPAALVRAATGSDAALAARAAWLLARGDQLDRQSFLQQVVATSPHADARLQAMQALLRKPEVGSTTTAVGALDDQDRRVRTLAAQLLGALARPTSREPLLALLQAQKNAAAGPATDVQAALLALHDLDAHDLLLRAATAVHDSDAQGVGEALAFCLQQLAPKLDRDQQQLLALGLLDHREPLARRFAITRLAELGDATTMKALEGRLATEGPELRPLVEVALAHLRRDSDHAPDADAAGALHGLDTKVRAWWQQSSPMEQGLVASSPVVVFVLLLLVLRRRRSDADPQQDGAAAAALVQPSAEFVAEHGVETTADTDGNAAPADANESNDANEATESAESVDAVPAALDDGEFAAESAQEPLPELADDDASQTELEVVGEGDSSTWQGDGDAAR